MNKIYVIGIGYKPLDKRAREIILNSEIILASKRLSEVFKGYEGYEAIKDKVKVINNVDETINFIRTHIKDTPPNSPLNKGGHGGVVLLASGDPTFFGIGRRAVREFGKDAVEIFPDLSSIQIAFSRIKESWDDAFLMSLHGGPDPEKRRRLPYELDDIPYLLQRHNKILILTDKENNPVVIAKHLEQQSSRAAEQRTTTLLHYCPIALLFYCSAFFIRIRCLSSRLYSGKLFS
ncbi:MAG: precorrin-6y C5,15-methyltransferase (decarboxylating) subunit CbiE [Thermodesulfovibrionales bacterium]|nr:precorrin-6y C5,15-methyltransferase (decarboxylating) subunit CbiE [Thermodesulfovibrionales bacterium]